jgi:tetratricopeptide (TPR) repeat protein
MKRSRQAVRLVQVQIRISMKFSNSYILCPDNKALGKAVEHCRSLLSADAREENKAMSPGNSSDILRKNTLGQFEAQGYDSQILETVRESLENALTEDYRRQTPLDWATTQDHLGIVLATLAQSRGDAGLLQRSIQAFNNALEEWHQENTPRQWASTQFNLATVLQVSGQQRGDSKILKQSVDAYTSTLTEWTREKTPQQWASTMFNLGITFHIHGTLLKGNRTFQKSVVAYKNALAELNADRDPLELTITHNNRAAVLQSLGESEQNPERLQEAIRSYETALTVCQEQQLPIHLAVMIKANLATSRNELAELTQDPAVAEEVADDLELILELFDNACHPECLEHCREQLQRAQKMAVAFV